MPKDPYRYFRIEAHELMEGLGEGLLALERDGEDPEVLKRVLRQAHTLKGASRVVKRGDIGDLAHQIEDLVAAHQNAGESVPRSTIDAALALLDRVRDRVATLGSPDAARPETSGETVAASLSDESRGPQRSIRVAVDELDHLLESTAEARTAASALRGMSDVWASLLETAREIRTDLLGATPARPGAPNLDGLVDALDRAHRDLSERIEQVLGEVDEVRALASTLRLVPAESLMRDLERVVRDAATSIDKEVALEVVGAQTRLDAHVLAGLRTALVHIVRNSVAHGVEAPAARLRAGKTRTGRIEIRIERRGHRIAIACEDDGQGVDLVAVRDVAVRRGVIDHEAAASMSENALAQLLLAGGVSTSDDVTELSGRGVGLDAVRHAVDELNGDVEIRSRPGAGTVVELRVPLLLSSIPALSMEVDEQDVLVPLDSVRRTLRVAPDEIARHEGGAHIVVGEAVVPFLSLRQALGHARAGRAGNQSVVVVEAKGRQAAIGVDRLGAAREVVVHRLPEHAQVDPIVAGAAFGEDGVPRPVLAPSALVEAAWTPGRVASDVPTATRPLPLLVIDDSLTTRMLEQSILESAGYEVDLAVSAEDGLRKARARRYGLFIVDVEMPGMSGFEFLATVRTDAELGGIPSILVTSRSDPEDKRRGKEVGARAYVVKSQFDQARLLETIRSLVG